MESKEAPGGKIENKEVCYMRWHSIIISILIAASVTGAADAEERFELLSRSLLQGPAQAIAFFEGGFVLGSGGGIAVYSGAESLSTPVILLVNGEPREIAIRGPAAYVAANKGGLVTIDLTDPANPVETRTHRLSRAILCSLSTEFLFLADHKGDIYTFKLSDPLRPELIDERRVFPTPVSMDIAGGLLVTVSTREVKIFRIGKNGNLKGISQTAAGEDLSKCKLRNEVLYALSPDGTVLRWDISDPAEPKRLPAIEDKKILDFALGEDEGYLLTKYREIIPFEYGGGTKTGKPLEITFSAAGGASGKLNHVLDTIQEKINPGDHIGRALFIDGNTIITTSGLKGLSLFMLEGEKIRLVGKVPTGGFAIDLIVSDDLLYCANGFDGVRIGRVSGRGSIEWIGHLQSYHARDVALNGDVLILADGEDGLKTIDVSDPRKPIVIGKHRSPYFMSAVMSDGTFAYVAGGKGGAEIIDISNPKRPKLIWRKEFSEMRGIDYDSRYCYIADGYDGLRTFSISGGKPVLISTHDTPGWNCDVFINGDIAYLADGGKGIRVVDISDRSKPLELGKVNLNVLTRELHAVNGILFAAAFTAGIIAVDVSDPRALRVAATFQTVDDGRGVFADDRFVYLASGSGGVYVFKYNR